MEELRDPRVDSWPLMSSVWPTVVICILYIWLVKVRPTYTFYVLTVHHALSALRSLVQVRGFEVLVQ